VTSEKVNDLLKQVDGELKGLTQNLNMQSGPDLDIKQLSSSIEEVCAKATPKTDCTEIMRRMSNLI